MGGPAVEDSGTGSGPAVLPRGVVAQSKEVGLPGVGLLGVTSKGVEAGGEGLERVREGFICPITQVGLDCGWAMVYSNCCKTNVLAGCHPSLESVKNSV